MEEKKWENPSIRVVWEDYPENITQEKTKDIRQYFAKKYSSSNVQVITKSRSNFDSNSTKILQTIDVSSNILDANYQNNLIKKMLEVNQGLADNMLLSDMPGKKVQYLADRPMIEKTNYVLAENGEIFLNDYTAAYQSINY
jgi:uncharacterized membrane protein